MHGVVPGCQRRYSCSYLSLELRRLNYIVKMQSNTWNPRCSQHFSVVFAPPKVYSTPPTRRLSHNGSYINVRDIAHLSYPSATSVHERASRAVLSCGDMASDLADMTLWSRRLTRRPSSLIVNSGNTRAPNMYSIIRVGCGRRGPHCGFGNCLVGSTWPLKCT